MNLTQERKWIQKELETVAGFWLTNGMDKKHGGVYTCLDKDGKVFSTDKSVWMQGRCGWIFAYLCHIYGVKKEWLEASRSCLDFLEKYCVNRGAEGRLYFTVTEDGRPLRQRRYCYWATLHKEVKVFIGSFPLKHYEKLPKYASITGVLSFPLNEKFLNKNCLAP